VRLVAVLVWGGVIALWLTWPHLTSGPGEWYWNHENFSYVYRLVEFSDCLRAGYAFPQWATDFRGGLGSPYFTYYHPGFFYVSSAFLFLGSANRALGASLFLFALVGYAGTFALVSKRFGTAAGVIAGSALLFSNHARTELFIRGDLSEFSAMMLLPALLYWLDEWIDRGRRSAWLSLTLGCGALMVLHSGGGLLGYGLLGLAIAWFAFRSYERALWAVGALGLGAALVCWYWLPIFREWDFVTSERAFSGTYRYAFHFVSPTGLFGDPTARALIPTGLGMPTLALLGVNALRLRWAPADPVRRRWIGFLWVAMVTSVFLMSSTSTWIWDHLSLLQRIQFPWRIMLLVTVCAAVLGGAVIPFATERRQIAFAAVAVTVLAAFAVSSPRAHRLVYRQPTSGHDIAQTFFAPDVRDEWMPRKAKRLVRDAVPADPVCGGDCRIVAFDRDQGRLHCRVRTTGSEWLILPHYFFPVGWRATIDGTLVTLGRSPQGLMMIGVPGGGEHDVEVRFSMTPMRATGLELSALALAVWVGLLVTGHPRGS